MVDPAGRLWVADGTNGTATIRVFAASANGNVAPVEVLGGSQVLLIWPVALGMDGAGRLYVVDRGANAIKVWAPGVTGNSPSVRTISGPSTGLQDPAGIAVDAAGTVHVANQTLGTITTYAPGAGGNATPLRTLVGSATGLTNPAQMTLDPLGELYVAEEGGQLAVLVFSSATPSGNSPPRLRLTAADLGKPRALAVDAQRRLTVLNDDAVLTFAPLPAPPPPVSAPSAVTRLKVKGAKTAAKRKVTWAAPATTGGAPITGYVVTVRKGRKVLLTKTVTTTKVTLKRKKLRPGRLTLTVTAVNSAGSGAAAKVKLKVAR
jgi:hypothetical protein